MARDLYEFEVLIEVQFEILKIEKRTKWDPHFQILKRDLYRIETSIEMHILLNQEEKWKAKLRSWKWD
jgi:hypothetical protein